MPDKVCDKHQLMDYMDEDEEPLIFKRSSSTAKKNQSNSEAKKLSSQEPLVFKRSSSSGEKNQSNVVTGKSSSQKHSEQLWRPEPNVRSQNGQSSMVQKGKAVSSSKASPIESPLGSSKPSNSSAKSLPVKPSVVKSKPSTLVTEAAKSIKQGIKEKKPSTQVACEPDEDPEDSEDDKPLSARVPVGLSKVKANHVNNGKHASVSSQKPIIPKSEDSDDEIPLSSKFQVKSNAGLSTSRSYNSGGKKTLLSRTDQNGIASAERHPSTISKKRPADGVNSSGQSSVKKAKLLDPSNPNTNKESSVKVETKVEDVESHAPIPQRIKKPTLSDKESSSKSVTQSISSISKKTNKKSKKVVKKSKYSMSSMVPPSSGFVPKWTTLVHNAVIFPPPYKPHGVKMLYKGKPVDLTPEQEEVATMYAVMLDTEYMSKPKFKENFMTDWQNILGKNHIIQSLEHCDFTPIYEWHQKEKEKKKTDECC